MAMNVYFEMYLLIINLFTFVVFGIDKQKAIKKKYRVPEKTLFLLATMGGSVGALMGMFRFRHKTSKWDFRIGIPLIRGIQIFGMIYWYL